MIKMFYILLLCLIITFGCGSKKQEKIWGIASLQIIDSKTIIVRDKTQGLESGLFFQDKKGNFVNELKIKIGETFLHTDRRHVFTYYRLIGIKDGEAIFHRKDVFDARSFGGRNKISRATIKVKPYSIEDK